MTVSVTGLEEEQSVSATAEPPPTPEDVNRDDVVNILDLVLVAANLGNRGTDLAADVNGDNDCEHPGFGFGSGCAWERGGRTASDPRIATWRSLTARTEVASLVDPSTNARFVGCNDPNGCARARATRGCPDSGEDGIAAQLSESVQPGDVDTFPTLKGCGSHADDI